MSTTTVRPTRDGYAIILEGATFHLTDHPDSDVAGQLISVAGKLPTDDPRWQQAVDAFSQRYDSPEMAQRYIKFK